MSLSRKLQIRQRTSSRIHKRDRISHLRNTSPPAKPTTIQKHHNRHTTKTMLITVNLKPATLTTLTPHRSVRQHQRGMRMTEQRWTGLNLIIRKPGSSTNPTTTRININAHLTGGFHLNNRVLRVILIRPNRHKPAPKNQLLFLHDLRLRIQVVVLPTLLHLFRELILTRKIKRLEPLPVRHSIHNSATPVRYRLKPTQLRWHSQPDML